MERFSWCNLRWASQKHCFDKEDFTAWTAKTRELAQLLNVQSTPTLLINGIKLSHLPDLDELDAMVRTTLSGNSPAPAPTGGLSHYPAKILRGLSALAHLSTG